LSIFKYIPLFVYLLIAYLIVFALQGENAASALSSVILSVNLFSGAVFNLTWNGILLILGVMFLFVEIIKSTRTTNASIIDHMLSALVFIAFLVIFIVMKGAASEAYFVIMMMSLVDVIAGFSITITSARKDFNMDRQL